MRDKMRPFLLSLLMFGVVLAATPAGAVTVGLEVVAEGLTAPLGLISPPDFDPTWVFAHSRFSNRWDVRVAYEREGWTGPVRAGPVVIKTEP